MRVLVIDDSKFSRMVLGNILKDGGYEVVGEACNGIQGLHKYKCVNPDFVTMDYTMPEINGIEAAKLIAQYDNKAIIIMCTALGSMFIKEEATNAGIRAFIVKPFEKEIVLEKIHNAFY